MSEFSPSMFRAKALDDYSQPHGRGCPRLASPRVLPFLFALCMLVAAGLPAWLVRVPVYAAGTFVAIRREESLAAAHAPDELSFAVFVPSQTLPDLRSGQTVYLTWPERGVSLHASIYEFERQPVSPETARRRSAMPCEAMSRAGGAPLAVAYARAVVADAPGVRAADLYDGFGEARVEVGSRRALSFLFDFGRYFKGAQD